MSSWASSPSPDNEATWIAYCATYNTVPNSKTIFNAFKFQLGPGAPPDYKPSVYPRYFAPVYFLDQGRPQIDFAYWSMLPRGTTDPKGFKYATYNAVSEEVETKRLYKDPWQNNQRCVIPAVSFFEWIGEAGAKRRLEFRPVDSEILFIAGLWDRTSAKNGIFNFTMLTTKPNAVVSKVHDRMPVILSDWEEWMNPDLTPIEAKKMCQPSILILSHS